MQQSINKMQGKQRLSIDENQEYKQYPYRYRIVAIFFSLAFVNGMCWVTASPISVPIAKAYGQSGTVVSIIPMSYMLVYLFINFPSNWVIDVKGVRKGIVVGAIFTAVGAGIRCLITTHFAFAILGQIICAIGQPFILNAPTKIAVRWFMRQNRSVALAILSVANIIGTAAGFILPPLFVIDSDSNDKIQSQFTVLLLFEFGLTLIPAVCVLLWFRQRPPTPASAGSQVQNVQYFTAIKRLFKDKKFLTLVYAFGTVLGSFNIYGSILDDILDCYGFSSDEVSYLAAVMMVVGIISAALLGLYIEKTLRYRRIFILLSICGILQSIGFPFMLAELGENFPIAIVLVFVQGAIFIPLMPLSFDYGCDILFPAGEAQITGCLMTSGNLFGLLFIIFAQNVFGLGDASNDTEQNKKASLNTVIMVGAVTISGVIFYLFFNSQLKRSKLQRQKASLSLLSN